MQTLHIISHTHWDREWYKTFQEFRLKLIHLVDNLLTILDSDENYLHYMLDGQTIVLEDYLQMRMSNFPRLQQHIQENRILIGPWYILPDEFLVSPEATIRNLLIGKQLCELFGKRMMVGYIPDPFGHISQMPQILNGFHIDTACLWRGVKNTSPTLLTWQSPDGSQVLLAHLYDGYGNLANWPASDMQKSLQQLDYESDFLEAYNPSSHFLLMRGSDHLGPRAELPQHLAFYNQNNHKGRSALHSTLPAYLAAVTSEIEERGFQLQALQGELRDPHKAHMLPAVLSARMWIKQRNHYSQNMLERWVEPFTTWAELIERGNSAFTPIRNPESSVRLADPGPIVRQAWKLLIMNHPHDSICGCSIDATHNDMISRFDQVDQIAQELTDQSLTALSASINTLPKTQEDQYAAVNVFNAAPFDKTELVELLVDVPANCEGVKILDSEGNIVPCQFDWEGRILQESNTYPVSQLAALMQGAVESGHNSQTLISACLVEENGQPCIEAEFSKVLQPDLESLNTIFSQLTNLIGTADPEGQVRVKVYQSMTARVRFLAQEVPAFGQKTFWVAEDSLGEYYYETLDPALDDFREGISNEYFSLKIENERGELSLYEKHTGKTYHGINSIRDVGDRGDEYNFTPPEFDLEFQPFIENVEVVKTPLEEYFLMHMTLNLPIELQESRDRRSEALQACPLDVIITLTRGIPAVDVQVQFDNLVKDHRLSVSFPTGLNVNLARYDGQFDILERPIDLPESDSTWRELPRSEVPQQAFADVSDQGGGLMIANRGLPEVSATRDPQGYVTLNLTLLRSVGWLSRDDLWNRQGHAGPPIPTPDAQELALYVFDYRIIPHGQDFFAAAQLAYTFQTPMNTKVSRLHEGVLSKHAKMIAFDQSEFLVTAIKEAENEEGYIVRGVNLSDHSINLRLTSQLPAKRAALVHLDESIQKDLMLCEDGSVELDVPAHKIVSLFFGLES